MNKELYDEILCALEDRNLWEMKQEGFYKVRFGGIKRSNKPYKNAPDMHYPLADSTIDKLKPMFIQQLYANDTLAQFVSQKQQTAEQTTQASEWFDYQLKQCSNFEEEIFSGIDQTQECGFITVKIYTKGGDICYSAVDNMHIVVPQWTEDLQDTDWLVHIIPISEAQYRANPNYTDKSDDFINSIKGKPSRTGAGEQGKSDLGKLREGLAYGRTKNEIVLWEVWRKSSSTDKATWVVDTISPIKGWDTSIRRSFGNPFKHGKLPFFRIRSEITKKGWYVPRGVPEILGSYQMGLKKLWDGSLQYVDFNCLPTYKNNSSTPIPNSENFKSAPGGVLPPGVDGASNPTAPIDFQVQMANMRAIAEDRISIPDLGSPLHLSGRPGEGGKTTATQINAEVGQSGQGNDMRARVFRLDLAKGFKLSWLTLIEIKKDALQYLLDSDLKTMDASALHPQYTITPNGSPDSWNKPQQLQKAYTRFQMFRGDPYCNQVELRKSVWELDDSRLVKRLLIDPGEALADQEEQQAQEISIMLLGFSPKVSKADDDKAHIKSIVEFVQRRMTAGEQITPELAKLLLMHGGEHDQGMKEKKDPMAKQVEALAMPVIQLLEQIASTPPNVVPMQQPGSATGNGAAGGNSVGPAFTPTAAPSDDPIGDAAKLMNGLAALIKAGVPVSHGQINKVMEDAGLPDLPLLPIAPVDPLRPPGHIQPPPQEAAGGEAA